MPIFYQMFLFSSSTQYCFFLKIDRLYNNQQSVGAEQYRTHRNYIPIDNPKMDIVESLFGRIPQNWWYAIYPPDCGHCDYLIKHLPISHEFMMKAFEESGCTYRGRLNWQAANNGLKPNFEFTFYRPKGRKHIITVRKCGNETIQHCSKDQEFGVVHRREDDNIIRPPLRTFNVGAYVRSEILKYSKKYDLTEYISELASSVGGVNSAKSTIEMDDAVDVQIESEDASNDLHECTGDVVEENYINVRQGYGSVSDEGTDYTMGIAQIARVRGIRKHTEEGARCGRGFPGDETVEYVTSVGQGYGGVSDEGVLLVELGHSDVGVEQVEHSAGGAKCACFNSTLEEYGVKKKDEAKLLQELVHKYTSNGILLTTTNCGNFSKLCYVQIPTVHAKSVESQKKKVYESFAKG